MSVTLEVADAMVWMHGAVPRGAILTSLPDAAEIDTDPDDYPIWLADAAVHCLVATSDDMPTVFFQTDRFHDGLVIDKAAVIYNAAIALGYRCTGHTIVRRKGSAYRPGFSHVIAFGAKRILRMSCEVIDPGGAMYRNGTPDIAAAVMVGYAIRCGARTIIDPFCGQGGILRAAVDAHLDVVGVDISPEAIAATERNLHERLPL